VSLHHYQEPSVWAENHFIGAQMSDLRRSNRVVTIAEAMASSPGCSLPEMFAHPYDVKAAYNLFQHPEATPDKLQAGHRDWVLEQVHQPGVYLLLEDTTEMSWSGKQPIKGLGPIGNGAAGLQGFLLHSVLAVRWPQLASTRHSSHRPPVEVLGLCDQQYYVRQPRPQGQPRESSQARKYRERESQVWEQAGRRIGEAEAGVRWVRVGDREGDIYEHLRGCQELGQGFVIRAAKDRALVNPQTGRREGRLFEVAGGAPALGEFELKLRARPQQPARTARLQVSATPVELSSPWRPGHAPGSQPSISCTVVRVWESEPPAGVEALEWMLLCDAEVESFEQALECALQYSTRWLIEEYHKALKSGLGAEKLQLETAERLFAAIAIMSVVALRLIDLRERVRIDPDGPAEEAGLEQVELEVLRARTGRQVETIREVALAIGRMGGHLNRKGDGMPGWQTLWRGMEKLDLLVEGVRIARKLTSFG
jgi:Transposase DNA-binding/Transposase Tn5 dimerisation domain